MASTQGVEFGPANPLKVETRVRTPLGLRIEHGFDQISLGVDYDGRASCRRILQDRGGEQRRLACARLTDDV